MRKIVTTALLAMSMVVMAQHVTPVSIKVMDLKLDSLRSKYISEPTMYLSALKVLEQDLEQDMATLKMARITLKDEQAHAKEMTATIQNAFKLAGNLRKTYDQEEKDLIEMQKTIEKQLTAMGKKVALNQETRDAYTEILATQQKELNYSLREVADRKRALTDVEEGLRSGQNKAQNYSHEVLQKATELDRLEKLCKSNKAALKNEQKVAKSIQ